MPIRKSGFFVVSALGMGMLATMAAGSSAPQPATTLTKQLMGKVWQEDQGTLRALTARRVTLATILIREAQSPRPATRAAAMYLLGLYRMARAVPMLAANVQFCYLFQVAILPVGNMRCVSSSVRGSSFQPAVAALIRIGSPAIPAMVKNLRMTADAKVAGCSAWVIRQVEGPDLGACVIRLALRKASVPLQKDRLRIAMKCVRSKAWHWRSLSLLTLPGHVKWPTGNAEK